MNFIKEYLHFTRAAESPTSFIYWTALGVLGAIMRDNIYLEPAYDRIYPNLYILCIARSGACRKGIPLKIASKFMRKIANTKIIAGQASIPAVMLELGDVTTDNIRSGLKGASGILYSEELSAFLVEDAQNIKVLTDLYDYHETYDKTLVTTGKISLKKVCLSLMAASNEELLRTVYTRQAVYGGLLARTIVVLEKGRRRKNSRMYEEETYDPTGIIEHLFVLSKTKGKAEIDNEAKKTYDKWYLSINDEDYDEEGVISRIHTTVLKVALCLAASSDPSCIIVKKKHIEEAIFKCIELIPNYAVLTAGIGISESAEPGRIFIEVLLRSPEYKIDRAEFLMHHFLDCSADDLDRITETLKQGNMIKVAAGKKGIYYALTQEGIAVLLEEKKNKLQKEIT